MNLNELKQLELPVTLKCHDGVYTKNYEEITVHSFNTKVFLVTNKNGDDDYFYIGVLKHFKVKKERNYCRILGKCL